MSYQLRKLVLTVHVTTSVGWVGAIAAYLALVATALARQTDDTTRAAFTAMELIGWFVIVPLAIASLLTGLVSALGTSWGLLSHYWVVFKFVLTVLATGVLLMNMPTVSNLAQMANEPTSATHEELLPGLQSQLLHASGGLLIVLVTVILGMYKPRGMTPFASRGTLG